MVEIRDDLILIVEDNVDIADLLRESLRLRGIPEENLAYTPTTAEARNFLASLERRLGLVILNQELPDGDGFTLLREFKEDKSHHRKVPVIIISGAPYVDKEICIGHGADSYFSKPFDLNEITEHIVKKLGG